MTLTKTQLAKERKAFEKWIEQKNSPVMWEAQNGVVLMMETPKVKWYYGKIALLVEGKKRLEISGEWQGWLARAEMGK